MRLPLLIGLLTVAAACRVETGPTPITDPAAPANLAYRLEPSGDPNAPLGVLLWWDPPANGRALTYEIYGRSGGGEYGLRATTTSPSFHDSGIPQLEYYILALDDRGGLMGETAPILIDERNRLAAPAGLTSITMNRAVQLRWSDNVIQSDADLFDHYRVYAADFDVARGNCSSQWFLEGTTSGEAFLVMNIENGVALCFAVSAVSYDGHESVWSNLHFDTPRPDARNALVYASPARADSSAFVFFEDGTRRLAVVAAPSRPDADFVVERQGDGSLWIVPARAGVTLQRFAGSPVAELSAIDRAPLTGYQSGALRATVGDGYVFRIVEGDGVHFASLRVGHTGADHLIFDWSYQTTVGSADLSQRRK